MDRILTNEQIIAGAKRIIDDVPIIDQDLEWFKNDIRYMTPEHLDMHAREITHRLLAISKLKMEKVWENDND